MSMQKEGKQVLCLLFAACGLSLSSSVWLADWLLREEWNHFSLTVVQHVASTSWMGNADWITLVYARQLLS